MLTTRGLLTVALSRGAVLACFELFHLEDGKKNKFVVEPMKKKHYKERYEVPGELRPKFEKYAVQVRECFLIRICVDFSKVAKLV